MRVLLLLCLWCGAAIGASVQQTATTILFVGNRFMYGGSTKVHNYNAATATDEPPGEPSVGGIPAIFKKLADEAGLRYEVHVETAGDEDLEFHYQHARDLLAWGKWDAVVLQGYSTEPLPAARGGKWDNFLHFAALLENLIQQAARELGILREEAVVLQKTADEVIRFMPQDVQPPASSAHS